MCFRSQMYISFVHCVVDLSNVYLYFMQDLDILLKHPITSCGKNYKYQWLYWGFSIWEGVALSS